MTPALRTVKIDRLDTFPGKRRGSEMVELFATVVLGTRDPVPFVAVTEDPTAQDTILNAQRSHGGTGFLTVTFVNSANGYRLTSVEEVEVFA